MADRIGVISKGELIVVEEKAVLMKKLGKKQLTLHLQEPMAAIPAGLADWRLALNAGGTELEYTFDAAEERTGIPALLRRLGELGIRLQGSQHPAELARGHLRQPGERAAMILEPPRRRGDLQVRDGALPAHAVAEPGDARDHDLALLRGVRRRHRLAHGRDRRRALRRLHRAGAHHARALHREPLQCLVRHLSAAVHRHDLRGPVRAGVGLRDGACLRRGGCDQVDHPRARHPGDRQPVRPGHHQPIRCG